MTNIDIDTAIQENSVTVFRSLIAELDFSRFEDAQLYDLGAIASESAVGLCQGLLCLSESLESCEALPPEGIPQVSAYLKATAHLLPMLLEVCEQVNVGLEKTAKAPSYTLN